MTNGGCTSTWCCGVEDNDTFIQKPHCLTDTDDSGSVTSICTDRTSTSSTSSSSACPLRRASSISSSGSFVYNRSVSFNLKANQFVEHDERHAVPAEHTWYHAEELMSMKKQAVAQARDFFVYNPQALYTRDILGSIYEYARMNSESNGVTDESQPPTRSWLPSLPRSVIENGLRQQLSHQVYQSSAGDVVVGLERILVGGIITNNKQARREVLLALKNMKETSADYVHQLLQHSSCWALWQQATTSSRVFAHELALALEASLQTNTATTIEEIPTLV